MRLDKSIQWSQKKNQGDYVILEAGHHFKMLLGSQVRCEQKLTICFGENVLVTQIWAVSVEWPFGMD